MSEANQIARRRLFTSKSGLLAIACVLWLLETLLCLSSDLAWLVTVLLLTPLMAPVSMLVTGYGGSDPSPMLVIMLWLLIPLLATLAALRGAWRCAWRVAFGWLSVPVAAALLFFAGRAAIDQVTFRYYRSSYDAVVADAVAGRCSTDDFRRWHVRIDAFDCSKPVAIVFLWGGFVSSWNGIVYDAADVIDEPADARPAWWKGRPIGKLLACSGGTRRMAPHYYRASGSYC